jgi:arylsulfatase A-like enzyme
MITKLVALSSFCLPSIAKDARPNILVIIVDDLRWAGVGFHSKAMTTPSLDKLAKEGTELSRFYAYPVCSPTRAALLSGNMPRRYGVVDALNGRDPGIPAGLQTIPSTFKAAGYQTSLIGKWHLGAATTPQKNGFEHFYGFLSSGVDYYKHTSRNGRVDWQRDGQMVNEEGYSTYLLADEAVKQLKTRDKDKPFYMQVAFNAPHDPIIATPELLEKHKGETNGLYNAVVEALDIGIGRIVNAVDSEKLGNDTIVVFFSDNGAGGRYGGSNAPLRMGKGSYYEGGIRTPALIRWPGKIASGKALAHPICVQDLFPTFATVAGVPMPKDLKIDGVSQWSAIRDGKVSERTPFLVAGYDIALVDGDWKLIEFQNGQRSLFNVKEDMVEQKDQITLQPEVAKRLGAKMDEMKKGLPATPARPAKPQGGPGSGRSRGNGGGSG